MQHLIDGYKKFHAEVFPTCRDQFHLLAEGQSPEYLLITCADSRVVPNLILQAGPGELFLARNAGNVVPVAGNDVDGITATIEYAVQVLKVKYAILCGHSDCGALKAVLYNKNVDDLPKVARWLHHIDAALEFKQPERPEEGENAELAAVIRGNVVAQLRNLKADPVVRQAMEAGTLQVFGWYYDILTGTIEQYDEKDRRFVALGE
ncbi:carbonic anhydrase [Terracidiphilus gabretensis]|uniref:carbonic anhydrase n=1 Tax=Terracidiphilus gabretensis TaxID=1577687 RepID=UPI00071B455A|nr:carbonic anhydrase [Terracidiphilus gabretensis]